MTTSTNDTRSPARRVTAMVLQALAVLDLAAEDSDHSSESFGFRDDIVIDALGAALGIVHAAQAELGNVDTHGDGPRFPGREVETCMLKPMPASTDVFPIDIVSSTLDRVDAILTVLVAGTENTGTLTVPHVAVTNLLWATTGYLDGAARALSRVSYLTVLRIERNAA